MNICFEKLQLLEDCTMATETFSAAMGLQLAKMGVVSKSEYEDLQHATEEAHRVSAAAYDRLERHIAQHGCQVGL